MSSSSRLSVANIWYQSGDYQNPSTMDFPAKISQSTQLLVQEIHKRFNDADARFDRLFAKLQQLARRSLSPHFDAEVVADD